MWEKTYQFSTVFSFASFRAGYFDHFVVCVSQGNWTSVLSLSLLLSIPNTYTCVLPLSENRESFSALRSRNHHYSVLQKLLLAEPLEAGISFAKPASTMLRVLAAPAHLSYFIPEINTPIRLFTRRFPTSFCFGKRACWPSRTGQTITQLCHRVPRRHNGPN